MKNVKVKKRIRKLKNGKVKKRIRKLKNGKVKMTNRPFHSPIRPVGPPIRPRDHPETLRNPRWAHFGSIPAGEPRRRVFETPFPAVIPGRSTSDTSRQTEPAPTRFGPRITHWRRGPAPWRVSMRPGSPRVGPAWRGERRWHPGVRGLRLRWPSPWGRRSGRRWAERPDGRRIARHVEDRRTCLSSDGFSMVHDPLWPRGIGWNRKSGPRRCTEGPV